MQIHRAAGGGAAIIITGIVLSGCISITHAGTVADQNPGTTPPVTLEVTAAEPQVESATPAQASITETPSETPTLEPTPTEDTRLRPEQWLQWPVIPTLSPAMVEVYLQGIEKGNNSHRFSKAGDCQNVPGMYLGIFDTPGSYFLRASESQLQETIDNFAGSFGRDSIAVKGGFTFPALFSPLRADPTQCSPGETPLECEIRIWDPSFLIVSMELPFTGRTPESYEEYLTQVVEYALSHGIVPVLTTKADNIEGDYSINQAITRVAYTYDVPMMNFWLSVQGLPNRGIDAEDTLFPGFHTSVMARSMRDYDTLRTLDGFLRTVMPLLPTN